jgi:large subunit ribosomal protein L13
MDMNKAFFLATEARQPRWHVIDATNMRVGRLATHIANVLRGKNKACYTPHTDSGDYVVVVNAEKIVFSGAKMQNKEYVWYTGYIGGQKTMTADKVMQRDPRRIIVKAVRGMFPDTKLADAQLKKLKVYAGAAHPHEGQIKGLGAQAA